MTRRRKDPFAGKENVRHFRLVQRPLGAEAIGGDSAADGTKMLNFDEMFEEYNPTGSKFETKEAEFEVEEEDEQEYDDSYDFANDEDGEMEMVDIDAELDRFTEEFIDIEGEDSGVDRIKKVTTVSAGEAAKFGILLDDRDYDYTKHLRKVGVTPGAVFIQAPGMKKSQSDKNNEKPRDFFANESTEKEDTEDFDYDSQSVPIVSEEEIKANHEAARQQFRSLLNQVSDDPVLREVIEALEDDRYVTEDIDDELVISLDNLNIHGQDEIVDILDEDEEFPEFIPSEALKRQMERIAAQEQAYELEEEKQDELDDILDEYNEDYNDMDDYSQARNNSFIDIEGDDNDLVVNGDAYDINEEEAEEIYKYLKEHGRARGTTLYDKKRPDHLPPIHIAIAQYNELRRELAVNNDQIIQKYAEEDEESSRKQIKESERIIKEMIKIIDDPEEMEKRLNIETAKYLLKLSETPISGPKKIVESTGGKREATEQNFDQNDSDSEEDFEEKLPRINKGAARSSTETAEEKKARKAKIKEEKREKRALKSEKNNSRK